MPNLRNWLHRKINGMHSTKDSPKVSDYAEPQLPILPPHRNYKLTPNSSSEDVIQPTPGNSIFFQRLPLEIRCQIYIAAFGGRTVHMDLRFEQPELPGSGHARLNPQSPERRDHSMDRTWLWWSSVCHRHPLLQPCEDQCRTASLPNTVCSLYPGIMPEKCFIGIMGWLLTCRKA